MVAPSGRCGVQSVPKAGQSCGFLRPAQNLAADADLGLARRNPATSKELLRIMARELAAQMVAAQGNSAIPRHLRSQTSKTVLISCCAARFPSRSRMREYWFSTGSATRLQLPDRHQRALQDVERFKAGDHNGNVVAGADGVVLPVAHDGADVARTEKTWTRLPGASRMASSAGGTSTCETSSERLFRDFFAGPPRQHGVGRGGRSKPIAKKTTCFFGLARAILRHSSGEYTTGHRRQAT